MGPTKEDGGLPNLRSKLSYGPPKSNGQSQNMFNLKCNGEISPNGCQTESRGNSKGREGEWRV